MPSKISRRDFLKLVAPVVVPLLMQPERVLDQIERLVGDGRKPGLATPSVNETGSAKPNILILVFDALSAEHLFVYGYPRETAPNLSRFAEQATVYHAHYAGGNFTTPGTASLLTGVYPWSHRAFNITSTVDPSFARKSLFSAFSDSGYQRIAYTHNWLANYFLHQFGPTDIELHLEPETFFLAGTPALYKLFGNDKNLAHRSIYHLARVQPTPKVMPGSLFLSLLNEMWLEQYEATYRQDLAALFPDGLPEEANSKSFYLLEQAMEGVATILSQAARPFLAYFHFYPPHHPYHPRREFIGKFLDGWSPPAKTPHFFSDGKSDEVLIDRCRRYDEFIAYADDEFGRFHRFMEQSGLLENTYVVFTADHGEMFERGVTGHNTPLLYNSLIRIPLLIHKPGQKKREDVYAPTSCVDLLPTLATAAGQPVPGWCEGQILPSFDGGKTSAGRGVFSVDARLNSKYHSLDRGTFSLVKGSYKLIYYRGYPGYENQFELYDLGNDSQEIHNLFPFRKAAATELKDELEATLREANQPF